MAAHLRPLPICQSPDCQKSATCTLYNTYNDRMGDFCTKHGEAALKRIEKETA